MMYTRSCFELQLTVRRLWSARARIYIVYSLQARGACQPNVLVATVWIYIIYMLLFMLTRMPHNTRTYICVQLLKINLHFNSDHFEDILLVTRFYPIYWFVFHMLFLKIETFIYNYVL